MLSDQNADFLKRLAQDVVAAETMLRVAKDLRDDAIRLALEEGSGPTELANLTDLTRERIYQIKQRRR